jgi:hypothetical protein
VAGRLADRLVQVAGRDQDRVPDLGAVDGRLGVRERRLVCVGGARRRGEHREHDHQPGQHAVYT